MPTVIKNTDFRFPNQTNVYFGKVRDVYRIKDDTLVMVATDRISAFDVVLPEGIPYKGQILNTIAAHFLQATADVVPNWLRAIPDPNVSVGIYAEAFRVEMVIRGYLCGHAWREYSSGKRLICGVPLPDGMNENDRLPEPIITPTTKAYEGHDEDISRAEIIDKGIVSSEDYLLLENYTKALFQRGTEMAAGRGLILADTKYEFGKAKGQVMLIDEVHTPDSSRYFYKDGFDERQKSKQPQKQLSKEFVRLWLMENGFQGKEGQAVPHMSKEVVDSISFRYRELYEKLTGIDFVPAGDADPAARILKNVSVALTGMHV